jgi:putative zinc finger protein
MNDYSYDPVRHAAEHDRFSMDDAAYVLGALEPDDRRAYEDHLAGCPLCQAQVAELRGTPALLDAADPESWATDSLPPSLLPRLLWQVGIQRRRRRLRIATVTAVAACLITLLAVLGVQTLRHEDQPRPLALQPLNSAVAAVKASVTLTPNAHGTTLRVVCGRYPGASDPVYPSPGASGGAEASPGAYRLVVVNRAGLQQSPTSWGPGRDIDVITSTNWPLKAISRIEIVDDEGQPILRVAL